MLGKEGVSTLAGYGASNLVYDKTNNQTLGMIIRKILQSRGSSLNERSHKCFKSGDAHLYLLQDNCEIGIKEKQ